MRVVALLILGFAFGAGEAHACFCTEAGVTVISPEDGAEGLPTNTVVFLNEFDSAVGFLGDGDLAWRIDGVYDTNIAATVYGYFQAGDTRAVSVVPDQDFPAEASVELMVLDGEVRVVQFATGLDRDATPPVWGGKYSYEYTYIDATSGCDMAFVRYTLEGASDDGGLQVVTLHAPIVAEGSYGFNVGDVVGRSLHERCGGDMSIADPAGRGADLTIYDVAGNALAGGRLNPQCGCRGRAEGDVAPIGAMMLFGAWRKRRRRNDRRLR